MKDIYIIKNIKRRFYFTFRSGVSADRIIGFEFKNRKFSDYAYCTLWVFLHWADIGLGIYYKRRK